MWRLYRRKQGGEESSEETSVESQTRDDGGLDMVGGAGSPGAESRLILNLF